MIHARHRVLGWMALGAAVFTSFYMFRLIFLTFTGQPRNEQLYHHARESPWVMVLPLMLLAVLSLGFVGSNRTFGLAGHESWFGHLVERPALAEYAGQKETQIVGLPARNAKSLREETGAFRESEGRAHRAHRLALVGSVSAFAVGLFVAFMVYYMRWIDAAKIARTLRPIHGFLLNKWYMDHLYQGIVVLPYLALCYTIRIFDTYVIDGIVNLCGRLGRGASWTVGHFDSGVVDGAVNGSAWTTGLAGRLLRATQTGQVRNYILFIVTGVAALLLLFAQL
jgi:NADH-quinone oxidoreductase subunit L